MKLRELLSILPEDLDVTVAQGVTRTSSSVFGLLAFNDLVDREVLYAEPTFIASIKLQSLFIRIKIK